MNHYSSRPYRICLLFLAVVLSVGLALPAGAQTLPSAADANSPAWTRDDAAHLLRRAGFGGTPGQIDKLFALGRDGAVDYLIDGTVLAGASGVFDAVKLDDFAMPPVAPLSAQDQQAVAAARALKRAEQAQPGAATRPSAAADQATLDAARAVQNKGRRDEAKNLQLLKTWWIDRMIRTDRPLEEKMTLFWHGLFTTGVKEVKNAEYLSDQDALFHREALGNYKKLTDEAIHGAAILKYLNNDQNVKGKPNENLAREMMELFTMGEGQGYTENDIKQVALALTGLSPVGNKKVGDPPVELRPRLHDTSTKTIFGKTGNFGPDDVVNLIFAQPQPAHHLAQKLWEFYAYPDPSDADLAPVIAALNHSGFELKPALKAMFTSAAFYSDKAKFALIKSPTELEVEQFRTLGQIPTGPEEVAVSNRLKSMNQELFQPPNVRGWVGGDNWITAATLYTRYNTCSADINGTLQQAGGGGGKANGANARAKNAQTPRTGADAIQPANVFASLGQTPAPQKVVDAAIDLLLQRPLQADKRTALLDFIGTEPLKLGETKSDGRVRQMLCLLLSTPEYQVH